MTYEIVKNDIFQMISSSDYYINHLTESFEKSSQAYCTLWRQFSTLDHFVKTVLRKR